MRIALLFLALLAASCGDSAPDGPEPVETLPTEAQAGNGEYISWHEHRIDDQGAAGGIELRGADGLATADFDADGFPDFVSAFEDSAHLRIAYGSDDPDTWFRLSLAEGQEAGGVEDADADDLNGDGRADLIVACEKAHLLYLQNPASEHRGFRWKRLIPEVTTGRGSWIRASFADLDGDGRPEVLGANKGDGGTLSWFSIDGDPLEQESWTEHVLAKVATPINIQAADLDGDGDLDIFAGVRGEERVLWFENVTEAGGELTFAEHAIAVSDGKTTGFQVAFHDFSGDGKLDAVVALDSTGIGWLEQPASPIEPWTTHRIGDIAPDEMTGITLADLDQDGDPDVFTGSYSRGPRQEDHPDEVNADDRLGRVAWFQNPGDAAGAWTRHDILRRERGMYDAWVPIDLDGDGDLDFVGTRGNSGEYDGLIWLEQRRSRGPVRRLEAIREKDSRAMPAP